MWVCLNKADNGIGIITVYVRRVIEKTRKTKALQTTAKESFFPRTMQLKVNLNCEENAGNKYNTFLEKSCLKN